MNVKFGFGRIGNCYSIIFFKIRQKQVYFLRELYACCTNVDSIFCLICFIKNWDQLPFVRVCWQTNRQVFSHALRRSLKEKAAIGHYNEAFECSSVCRHLVKCFYLCVDPSSVLYSWHFSNQFLCISLVENVLKVQQSVMVLRIFTDFFIFLSLSYFPLLPSSLHQNCKYI